MIGNISSKSTWLIIIHTDILFHMMWLGMILEDNFELIVSGRWHLPVQTDEAVSKEPLKTWHSAQ